MNGDIQAESVAGEGSTFVVNLPLARADAASQGPAQAQSTAAAAPAALRVLTAEDNENNQRVLRALLAAAGIETVMVANGQEALDAWRAAPWDIVLMDIQMPVMDGVTAAKLMRKVERLEHRRRTPIIAVTANAMTHQAAEYLAAGMDAMVAKPIDLTTLINAMDQALQFAEAS
jgi:CheY-like chemotaxis protein